MSCTRDRSFGKLSWAPQAVMDNGHINFDQRPISQSQKVCSYKDNICNYKCFWFLRIGSAATATGSFFAGNRRCASNHHDIFTASHENASKLMWWVYILQLPLCLNTSKCMHGMNQTETEYSGHGKGPQRASLSQIGPVVLEVWPYIYCACAQ